MLALVDLTKRFGDVTALDGLSMRVEPGRMHGFVGRNGAGKTTAMRIALGLVDPDAGEVTWNGAPPRPDDRRRFGYMPEERGLYPDMRVADQVAYFGELSGLARAEARDRARRWLDELGLGDRLGDRAAALSLGNQQRVQLAAALVQQPDLLVLDEPTASLDPDVALRVRTGLERLCAEQGTALLVTSHNMLEVERIAERVVFLSRGRVVADGSPAEVADRFDRGDLEGVFLRLAEEVPGEQMIAGRRR